MPLSGLLDYLICLLLIIFFGNISKDLYDKNHIIWKIRNQIVHETSLITLEQISNVISIDI